MSIVVQVLWSGSIVRSESTFESERDALHEIQAIVNDPTTEGEVIRAITSDGELFFKERSMFPLKDGRPSRLEFGAYGWPYDGASEHFPGEKCLTCPRCRSMNWTMGGAYAARGTAPAGRGRLGDPGATHWIDCGDCKLRTYGVTTMTETLMVMSEPHKRKAKVK